MPDSTWHLLELTVALVANGGCCAGEVEASDVLAFDGKLKRLFGIENFFWKTTRFFAKYEIAAFFKLGLKD